MIKENEWGVDRGCIVCKHIFLDIERLNKCTAFKKGIPFLILSGAQDHFKKLPNQNNDIVFELIKE